MLRRVTCPACGKRGSVLADDDQSIPPCPICGQPFEAQPSGFEESTGLEPSIEEIVSWVSQAGSLAELATLRACVSCGSERLMLYQSERGDLICAACLAVCWSQPHPVHEIALCPNCGQSIDLYESDRGKTIVCPDCNYFLGCMLRPEKRRFGALPFLNALLGTGDD
jgi:predicted amidophosphoribosyltransferase